MNRLREIPWIVAMVALLVPATASAREIGSSNGTGYVSASASARHPHTLEATVSTPKAVEISWGVDCTRNYTRKHRGDFDSASGQFIAGSSVVFRLPRPVKHPDRCHLNVSAIQSDFLLNPFLIRISLFAY